MLDAKKQHELEQAVAAMSEMMPPLWWGLYSGMVNQGFTEGQAIDLLKYQMMLTQMHNQPRRDDCSSDDWKGSNP